MIRSKVVSSLALIALLAGGAVPSVVSAQAAAGQAGTGAAAGAGDDLSYVLGVDDKMMIVVFGEDTLSREYAIGPNGMISMPLIGEVPAAGRAVGDVRSEITRRLADGFFKNPSVSIQITSFRPFYIMGEVVKPGEYPYRKGLTVMAAVATAQGFTYRAKKRYVFIKRMGQAQEERVLLTPDLQVQPGDTIRFEERYF